MGPRSNVFTEASFSRERDPKSQRRNSARQCQKDALNWPAIRLKHQLRV